MRTDLRTYLTESLCSVQFLYLLTLCFDFCAVLNRRYGDGGGDCDSGDNDSRHYPQGVWPLCEHAGSVRSMTREYLYNNRFII